MIEWITGVPPLNELKEDELILVVGEWKGVVEKPFVAGYAQGALHDEYSGEPFYEGNVTKWARIEDEPDPEQKYYFITFIHYIKHTDTSRTHNGLIDMHPLDWQGGHDTNRIVLTSWVELPKDEYEKYKGAWS